MTQLFIATAGRPRGAGRGIIAAESRVYTPSPGDRSLPPIRGLWVVRQNGRTHHAGAEQTPRQTACRPSSAPLGMREGRVWMVEADFHFQRRPSASVRDRACAPFVHFRWPARREGPPVTLRKDQAMMWKRLAMNCAVLAFAAMLPAPAIAADDGWQARVGEALGKTGSSIPGGIYRVGLPRTDLKVTLDGVELKAGFALGSWLAFENGRQRHGDGRSSADH